jgi:hypothetical protein
MNQLRDAAVRSEMLQAEARDSSGSRYQTTANEDCVL